MYEVDRQDGEATLGDVYGAHDGRHVYVYRLFVHDALFVYSSATNRSPPVPTAAPPDVFAVTVTCLVDSVPPIVVGFVYGAGCHPTIANHHSRATRRDVQRPLRSTSAHRLLPLTQSRT